LFATIAPIETRSATTVSTASSSSGRPVRAVRRRHQPRADDVAREVEQLPRRDRLAEELGRRVRQLVRLVEHHHVGRRQQLGDRVLAQREVGAEQVVVDDHQVGRERLAASPEHEAPRQIGAVLPEAVLAGRRGPAPGRVVLGEPGALGPVAGGARGGEPVDPPQLDRRARVGEPPVGHVALEVMVADVVRTTLQQRGPHVHAERGAHRRQVAGVQLVLQVARAGRDHRLAAREQQRHQVCVGLAGPGAGLRDQGAALGDRPRDARGQGLLAVARPESRHRAGERTAVGERVAGSGGEVGCV
jgi:hypothetical protein